MSIEREEQPYYIFKICLLGQGGVGKTSIAIAIAGFASIFHGKNTLIIDGDLTGTSLFDVQGCSNDHKPEYFNELIAIAQQYFDNKEAFLEQEKIKNQEFEIKRETLFKSYDTTAEKYVSFLSKNERAVKEYLDDHPDIEDTLEKLSEDVNSLLDQYESLKDSIINPPSS